MADLVYHPVITLAKGMFRALGLRFAMSGTEHIPRTGGAVLASNHLSYLDFIFVGYATQPAGRLVRFMAKEAVFHHPLSGPLMRGMRHIPVDRSAGAGSYTVAVDALRRGEVVGVFPEATISRSFVPKSCKTGAARMAMAAGVPLIPMVTFGGQRIWTKGYPWGLTRGRTVIISVGSPLSYAAEEAPAAVTARLRAALDGLVEDAVRRYPREDGDEWWIPAQYGGTAPLVDRRGN